MPLGVGIRVLLCAIVVFLLDSETFDIVRVHDLLDALVVIEDRQAWHLVELSQVAIIAVASANELIRSVLERVALKVGVFHRTLHPLIVRLLGPVGPLVVVERE